MILKADDFKGDLLAFLEKYAYPPRLTLKLDSLDSVEFNQELVNEIVLWKVNRYVEADVEVLRKIESVRNLGPGEHRQGEDVLADLLATKGVDAAMASTLLRFRNAAVFQIMDRHAYRAVYGVKLPFRVPEKSRFISGIWTNLWHSVNGSGLPFETAGLSC